MKVKTLFLIVFVCLGSYSVNGQVDILKSQEETARRLDELDGKSTPQRRASGENSSRYEHPNNNRTRQENNELRRQWEEMLGRNMELYIEGINEFNTPETKCIGIMVIYLATYMDLVEQTYAANDCKTKSDGYALQAIAIAAANTILYCPESLANLTHEERERIWYEDLASIRAKRDDIIFIKEWERKLLRVIGGENNGLGGINIDEMSKFFHPNYTITQLLDIQQSLEELNCPD